MKTTGNTTKNADSLKTLDEKAAALNYYREENIPARYLETQETEFSNPYSSKWKLNDKNWMIQKPAGLENFVSAVYWKGTHDIDINGNIRSYYLDRPSVLILTPAGNVARLASHKGKSYFYPEWDLLRGVQYPSKFEPKNPNQIGVFTDKKVLSWLEWVDSFLINLDKERERVNGKVSEYQTLKESLKDIPGTRHNTEKALTIYNGKWTFEIRVHDDGYIHREVTYNGNFEHALKLIRMEAGK